MSASPIPSEPAAARTLAADIINSIDVPIIAVGGDRAISRFNPAAATLFSLTPADIGRPLREIPMLTHVKRLEELCGEAIGSGASSQCEVRDATNGSWFVVRIAPYMGSEQRIVGAVLTLQNVTAFRASLEQAIYEREYTKAIINTVIDPLVVLDDDCRVQAANQAFYTRFQVSRDQAQGARLYDIGSRDWEIPRLQRFLKETHADNESDAEFEHEFPAIGHRTVLLNASRLAQGGNVRQMTLLVIQDITERKQREQARRRAEEELRDFVENATVGMHWVGPDGIVLWVNQGELDLLGYTREEYVGHHIAEFHADRPVISDMLARLIRGEALQEHEARLRSKDGSIRHVLVDSSGLFEEGKFLHTRCFTRDITEQKLAAKRLATQYAITRVLGESEGLLEAAPKLIRAVCETADWEIGALWRVDKTARQLRCLEFVRCVSKEVPGFEAATRSCSFSLGTGLPGRVWSSGEPAWIPDVTQDGNFPRAFAAVQDGLRGAFAFPVRAGNQILGVMEFFSAEVRQPEPELIDLLTGFGNQIGQFAERKRAEAELRESERWFREMVDALPAAVYTTDAQGRITHFNPAAVEFAGRVPELGTDQWCVTWKLFRPDGTPLPHDECPMAVALKEGQIVDGMETIAERPDGKRLWCVPYPRPLRDAEGGIVGGINLLMDITERKQVEEDLRESKEQLRILADDLDQKVRVRTGQLEKRNADVLRQSQQLRELSHRLMRTQDEERRHIARELHDSAGQIVTALGMSLADISRQVGQNPQLGKSVKDSEALVQQLSKEIRTTSYLLHPPLLEESGVAGALRWYVDGLTERSGLDIRLSVPEDFERLPSEMELVMFRFVQECLTNIHRHSGSKIAAIRISREPKRIHLEVQDEGKGISPEKLAEIQSQGSGVGIAGMRERVRQLEGDMSIQSNGSGTKICVTFPVPGTATLTLQTIVQQLRATG
jgi:PAS domain S-box-containing protein